MVMFWASGGIQVQTSLFGLNNMPKCISAINDLKKVGIPFISVFTNPVAGGVTCIALLGDINLAEPKSTISFAGRRVIEQNIREKLPENFQSSEWAFDIGIIDIVCQRKDLRKTISTILSQLTNKNKTFFSDSQIINERQQSPLGTIRSINSISKTSP
jgi:acetyl-CoA carboxylase carboxyl transferase subunit beta